MGGFTGARSCEYGRWRIQNTFRGTGSVLHIACSLNSFDGGAGFLQSVLDLVEGSFALARSSRAIGGGCPGGASSGALYFTHGSHVKAAGNPCISSFLFRAPAFPVRAVSKTSDMECIVADARM